MNHSRLPSVIAAAALIGILGLVILIRGLEPSEQDKIQAVLLRYAQAGHLGSTSSGWVGLDEALIGACLDELDYKHKKSLRGFQINRPFKADHLNIYLVANDPEGAFLKYKDNCAALGFGNIIICDYSFVIELQTRRTGKPLPGTTTSSGESVNAITDAITKNLWMWLVSHEIGHIAHGNQGRRLTFGEHFENRSVNGNGNETHPLQIQDLYQKAEHEADSFAIEALRRLGPAGYAIAFHLYMGLNYIVYSEGHRLLAAQGKTESRILVDHDPVIVPVKRSAGHPPLFIRAVEIGGRLIDTYDLEKPNRYNDLKSRIRLIVEKEDK